jgi:two-component system response regulator YesN
MRKVILVDDETFVRKGLLEIIPWREYGFEIIAEAEDGEEAALLIEKLDPDLVITDIRMPLMDGLSLIDSVKRSGRFNPAFIILSGYGDFKYAQQAVRFGVQDFILKPIDEEELIETLNRINEKWEREQAARTSAAQLLPVAAFESLIYGKGEDIEPSVASKVLGLPEGGRLCYFIVERNNGGRESESETEAALGRWKTAITDSLSRRGAGSLPYLHNHGPYAFGLIVTAEHLSTFADSWVELAYQLHRGVGREETLNARIYTGAVVTMPETLKLSYHQACEAMNHKYAMEEHVIITHDMASRSSLAYRDLEPGIYSELMGRLEEYDIPALSDAVSRIFNDFQTYSFAPESIAASITKCLLGITEIVRSMEGDAAQELPSLKEMLQWNQKPRTLSGLKKDMTAFMLESADYIDRLRKEKSFGGIHRIKQYILTHYQEDISLKSIAKRFYMNPVYLGQLFKKRYGVYFNEFLLDLRIKEAKRLLRQTDWKIYEIAEAVGFSSSEYFIKQFEKVERRTPTEYKMMMLTNL